MVITITDLGFENHHEAHVNLKVRQLTRDGYSVTRIDRVRRMRFGIFGANVTDIYYE